MKLIIYPNKILREVSVEVAKISDQTNKTALEMVKTMEAHQGIGLAAPQVGILQRIVVVHKSALGSKENLILINPKILQKSKETYFDQEGCLSIPNQTGQVERFVEIEVQAQNVKSETIVFKAKKLFARVIQHEIDHLNGVLFIDKAKDLKNN